MFDESANPKLLLNTAVGGWITSPYQLAVAKLPERRQIEGTLQELTEPFLRGMLLKDTNIVNAILTFTRGDELPIAEEDDPRWTGDKACGGCGDPKNTTFKGCIVLRQPGFQACANCFLRGCHDTCTLRYNNEDPGASAICALGSGTKEDPIDLTGDD